MPAKYFRGLLRDLTAAFFGLYKEFDVALSVADGCRVLLILLTVDYESRFYRSRENGM
jgi:hypothetical protein